MKKQFELLKTAILALIFLIMGLCANAQVIDIDENSYTTTTIGEQTWMAENLKVKHFANGDKIPESITSEEWALAGKEGKPTWMKCANTNENLYNWYAATDERGLAPKGWHIPSEEEWNQLIEVLGGFQVAHVKLKATKGWKDEGFYVQVDELTGENEFRENANGDNISGFNAVPAGLINHRGSCEFHGTAVYWWTSTFKKSPLQHGIDRAASVYLFNEADFVVRQTQSREFGLSVRCVKD